MRPEHRRLFLASAAVLCLATPALGEDAGRYALSASRDGFVRLDTATGAVSHCRSEKGIWRCESLTTDDARLDALAAQVAKLTATVAALDARIAALAPVNTVGAPPAEPPAGMVQRTLARFLDLVRTLKHGRASPA